MAEPTAVSSHPALFSCERTVRGGQLPADTGSRTVPRDVARVQARSRCLPPRTAIIESHSVLPVHACGDREAHEKRPVNVSITDVRAADEIHVIPKPNAAVSSRHAWKVMRRSFMPSSRFGLSGQHTWLVARCPAHVSGSAREKIRSWTYRCRAGRGHGRARRRAIRIPNSTSSRTTQRSLRSSPDVPLPCRMWTSGRAPSPCRVLARCGYDPVCPPVRLRRS